MGALHARINRSNNISLLDNGWLHRRSRTVHLAQPGTRLAELDIEDAEARAAMYFGRRGRGDLPALRCRYQFDVDVDDVIASGRINLLVNAMNLKRLSLCSRMVAVHMM
jgi:hypothetical protein